MLRTSYQTKIKKMITLKLSDDQCEKLIASIYMAGWITTSHLDDDETGPFNDLEQVVLEQAAAQGLTEYTVQNEVTGTFGYTEKASEAFDKILEEYDDVTFWEELSTRLAERDASLMRLKGDEKAEKIIHLADKYDIELERNGLKNMFIKHKH